MSVLRRAVAAVQDKVTKKKAGHLRVVKSEAPSSPASHGETPATVDESDAPPSGPER
jgi:hypothetical protein